MDTAIIFLTICPSSMPGYGLLKKKCNISSFYKPPRVCFTWFDTL